MNKDNEDTGDNFADPAYYDPDTDSYVGIPGIPWTRPAQ